MAGLSRFIKQHKAAFFSFVAITSVALVSSGSAMWMLTLKAMGEKTGNVYVGVVTDAKVVFSDVQFVKTNEDDDVQDCSRIGFDAAKGDETGRVRCDNLKGEHLTVTLAGKLNAYNFVKKCTYQLTVPDSIKNAISLKYIALNTGDNKYDSNLDYIKSPQEFTLTPILNDGVDSGIASFSVTVGFIWGEYFQGMNPSIYYDLEEVTKEKSIEQITSEFNEFRRIMYGYPEDTVVPNNVDDLQFTVTLTALTSGSYSSSTTTSEGNQ